MKILKYLVAFGAVASLTTGCIKEELPTRYVSNEQMAESPAALVNGMNAWLTTFNTMGLAGGQHYDFGWPGICMGTDALTPDVAVTYYGYDPGFLNWRGVTPELSQEGAAPRFIWNFCYSLINMANTLIGQIDPENMSTTQQEYLGQALVYRALAYFHLARIFEYKGTEHGAWDGLSVPIVDENTSELMGRRNPRVETDKLYDELILPDLQNAVKYLEGYTRTAKNKVDQAVAYGMLARVYLQREQWKDAEEAATNAIELSGATPLTEAQWMSPTTGFNDISTPAWMWGIIVTADNRVVTTGICNFVSFMSPEATYGYSAAGGWSSAKQIDAALFAKIPDTDWRKRSWVNPDREKYPYSYYQTTLDKKTWENSIQDYTGFKFRPGEGNGVTFSVGSVADFPLMRVEEMYLIQAEAAGMQNLSRGSSCSSRSCRPTATRASVRLLPMARAFRMRFSCSVRLSSGARVSSCSTTSVWTSRNSRAMPVRTTSRSAVITAPTAMHPGRRCRSRWLKSAPIRFSRTSRIPTRFSIVVPCGVSNV